MATATDTFSTTAAASHARPRLSWLRVLLYIVLITGAVASIVPFISMIMTSLKSYGSLITGTF